MKISFITTIYNEEKTIKLFLESLNAQSKQPNEIIIVDGGSTDETLSIISSFKFLISKIKIITKKGNRSVGRNEAISVATGDIIVCSDSGNILDKDWMKNITKPFHKNNIDVCAGYYKGKVENVFQKCIIPYTFVMPDKVNSKSFLPATRSIAFTKKIWKKVGGFDERLSHNEDYAFAQTLKRANATIVFAKDAIVYWIPRNTLKSTFVMFLRFAYGDAEARIFRPKAVFIFIRYLVAMLLISATLLTQSKQMLFLLSILFCLYILWAIWKNYRYVKEWHAFYILPMLQLTSDIAVLLGTVQGFFRVWDTKKML